MRVLVAVSVAAGAASVSSACGLETRGSAVRGTTDEAGAEMPGADGAPREAGGDAPSGQQECLPPRVLCDGVCTDTAADPANCSACGKPCAAGQTCNDGKCDVLCLGATTACGGACVDTTSDPMNCGKCGIPCGGATPFCVAGVCVPDCGAAPNELCTPDAGPAYCANTATDRRNCGQCGRDCGSANFVCRNGTCEQLCATAATGSEVFAPNMVGCVGRVAYSARASLCPAGSAPCSVTQWVARRGTAKPTYNYWVDERLGWYGSRTNCLADTTGVYSCGGGIGGNPMRVCGANTDGVGNRCNWINCGYRSANPNQYLGGCEGNTTAGTLCCRP